MTCTLPFLVALWLARHPGKAETYAKLLVILTIPGILIAFLESRIEHIVWLNKVPPFLKIDDALAARYMASITRDASGAYRVKGIYSTPLSFAEALALLTPLCIHFSVQRYHPLLRILCATLIPLFFLCIRMMDARLGILGMIVSFLAYLLLWGMLEFQRKARSLWAATIVYAYPAAFGAVATAVLFVHRVRVLVLGGGEQASSTDARHEQIALAIPKILSHPFGYGAGNAATTLNYAPYGIITIDNYYLSLTLDYGIIGVIAFIGIFLAAVIGAATAIAKSSRGIDAREKLLLIPFSACATVFIVIRSVLSQEDNHILAFSLLGFLIGTLRQVQEAASRTPFRPEWAASHTPKHKHLPVTRGLPARVGK
jgi:O-antigen ligase